MVSCRSLKNGRASGGRENDEKQANRQTYDPIS
jgi:hypothetical protein